MAECVFCERIAQGQYIGLPGGMCVRFEPLNPVTPGHILIVPRLHVRDAVAMPDVTAYTMRAAAEFAEFYAEHCNIITSVGKHATQTIKHLHVHIVPRFEDDGLHLPWTGQQTDRKQEAV